MRGPGLAVMRGGRRAEASRRRRRAVWKGLTGPALQTRPRPALLVFGDGATHVRASLGRHRAPQGAGQGPDCKPRGAGSPAVSHGSRPGRGPAGPAGPAGAAGGNPALCCRSECRAQVDRFPAARFKKFATEEEAWAFVGKPAGPGGAEGTVCPRPRASRSQVARRVRLSPQHGETPFHGGDSQRADGLGGVCWNSVRDSPGGRGPPLRSSSVYFILFF